MCLIVFAWRVIPGVPVIDPGEAEELAVAGRDLKRLARDIAAGDVSPSVLRRRRARQAPGVPTEGDHR